MLRRREARRDLRVVEFGEAHAPSTRLVTQGTRLRTGDDDADDGANAGARGDKAPSSLSSTAMCATRSRATHNSPELMRGMGMGALVARCVNGTCSHEGLTCVQSNQ